MTAFLAALVATTTADDIPDGSRAAAVRAVTDTVGVALAGTTEPATRELLDVIGPTAGPASLFGGGRASALDAALANGTAAHALDFDDTHAHIRGHPSAPIVPAALAAAELAGRDGRAVVTAYAVGLEVAGRVGRAVGKSHAAQGFHSTATLGTLGAAAAAASVLGATEAQAATALGLAATQAAGLRASFGTMAKPLHAGTAARAGLLAARLAVRGYTAAPDGIEAFLAAFSGPDADRSAVTGEGPWQVSTPGLAVKKYACCNRAHRALDAVLELAPSPSADRIEVWLPAGQATPDGRVGPMIHPDPATGLQAKFSLPYVVATAVVDGAVPLAAFTDDAITRPEIRTVMSRVVLCNDPERPAEHPGADFVEVRAEGRAVAVAFARGDPRGGVPLTDGEIAAKYRDCAAYALDAERVEESLVALRDLDHVRDLRVLTDTW